MPATRIGSTMIDTSDGAVVTIRGMENGEIKSVFKRKTGRRGQSIPFDPNRFAFPRTVKRRENRRKTEISVHGEEVVRLAECLNLTVAEVLEAQSW